MPGMSAPTIEIVVEQQHIDAGARFNSTSCPIAIAARFRGLRSATMHHGGYLRMVAQKGYSTHYLNAAAGKWASLFDAGKPVKPQTFVFEKA